LHRRKPFRAARVSHTIAGRWGQIHIQDVMAVTSYA
jgi:hypothetical protein